MVLQVNDIDREIACRAIFLSQEDVAALLHKRDQLLQQIAKHMAIADIPIAKQGERGRRSWG